MNRLTTSFVALAVAACATFALTTHTGVANAQSNAMASTPAPVPPPQAPGAAAAVPRPVPTPGDAVRGKAKLMAYGCYECHGTAGQGNYSGFPKLAPHPLPIGAVFAYVRRPARDMPSYSTKILPDADLADIYAYLASIPDGKKAAEIPVLGSTTMHPK